MQVGQEEEVKFAHNMSKETNRPSSKIITAVFVAGIGMVGLAGCMEKAGLFQLRNVDGPAPTAVFGSDGRQETSGTPPSTQTPQPQLTLPFAQTQ